MNLRENLQKCHEYVRALEGERRKIEMFQRELPLCLQIITQAIEACKQQLSATTTAATTTTECLNGHSDCSEQTTSYGPVFEEFIPIKRARDGGGEEEDGDELESKKNSTDSNHENDKDVSWKKSDWLRSAQLWNQSPDPPNNTTKEERENEQPRKVSVVEVKTKAGEYHPFQKDKSRDGGVSWSTMDITTTTTTTTTAASAPAPVPATAERAAAGDCGASKKDEGDKEGGQARKARRSWSPELHRRFVNALKQLGGSHVATPKQIRELMKVDGLTNDEVKSHLQKYRLHARRPNPAVHTNASTQAQFVVVGGIWVPPPEFAAATTLGEATATVTAAPAPAVQPHEATTVLSQRREHLQEQSSKSVGSHSGGGAARCNSPATSSSTRTITASRAQ